LILIECLFTGYGHDGELPIIIHPRRRLMRLFESADLVGGIGIHPSVAHFAGWWRPEIHAPWPGDCRIGVAVGEQVNGLRAHQGIYVIEWIFNAAYFLCGGNEREQGEQKGHW